MPDPGVRSDVSPTLKQKLAAAGPDNTYILGVWYIGRDDTGKPMYRVKYASTPYPGNLVNMKNVNRMAVTKTISFDGKTWLKPRINKANTGSRVSSDAVINNAKKFWLSWIADAHLSSVISKNTANGLRDMVNNWKGTGLDLNKQMRFIEANQPVGPGNIVARGPEEPDLPDFDFGFGGGGGFEPVYEAPDRRVVEDMVKGTFVSLVGTIPDDTLVEAGVNLYMRDHRRDWDTPDREIDPSMSVLEYVRSTEQYQAIHELRPDSEDERSWVSDRRVAAAQGGLNLGAQEDFAIEQASIGGDLQDVRTSAAMSQVQTSGSARGTSIEDRMKATATQMFRSVVR